MPMPHIDVYVATVAVLDYIDTSVGVAVEY
jgi:hypothetical protein